MLVQMLMLSLFACPDPTTAADLGNPGPGGAEPGAPGGPQAAMDGPPPAPGNFNVEAGTGVIIEGSISYPGALEGQLRLDFLATEDDAPPRLLHVEKLNGFGTFSVSTPPNTGAVAIVGFVDVDEDGPSPKDPAGMIRVNIEETNITGADIELSDDPDLGDLTPGDVTPPSAEEPSSGSAPTDPQVEPTDSTEPEKEAVEPPAPEAEPAPADKGNNE